MNEILEPKQIAYIQSMRKESHLYPWDELLTSHEALRVERDSWQATAEELGDKNVNKALTQRHEMREAALQKQLAEVQKDLRMGNHLYAELTDKCNDLEIALVRSILAVKEQNERS